MISKTREREYPLRVNVVVINKLNTRPLGFRGLEHIVLAGVPLAGCELLDFGWAVSLVLDLVVDAPLHDHGLEHRADNQSPLHLWGCVSCRLEHTQVNACTVADLAELPPEADQSHAGRFVAPNRTVPCSPKPARMSPAATGRRI